jgi:tetratricopeptide (TPR) repeat protein
MNKRAWGLAVGAAVLGMCGSALGQPWVDREQGQRLLREEKFPEAAAAYGAIAQGNPFDGDAWSQLGYCLHAAKKYDEALKAYAKAIELGIRPPTNLYNTACAYALMGKKDDALTWLEKAMVARFAEQGTLENDTDLDSLRDDPRFAALTGITKGLKDKSATTREAGWAWDLDFFARRMNQMHWDLYAKVSKEQFLKEVDGLKKEAGSLSDSQIRVRLRKITAIVGDGHTASRLWAEGEPRRSLPLHLFAFSDGVYIIGAGSSQAELIGAKVLKVGALDIDAAMKATRPYNSVDNDMGYLAGGPALLCAPPILLAIGAAPDEAGAELTVQKKGGETAKVRVEPESFPATGHGGFLMPGFTYMHDGATGERPLFLRGEGEPLRTEHLPESKTMYFWFGGVVNPHGGTFREFTDQMFEEIKAKGVENLVIDMRFNGGGNTGLVRPLLQSLVKNETINQRGHLWVLIGRNTFSAAQNTVNLLEQQTSATFVGEPTGSRPIFVGESTWFVLPHSKTRVTCSSRYWQMGDSTDERTWVQPAIAAPMSFAAYAAGGDPAIEAVMKWVAAGPVKK